MCNAERVGILSIQTLQTCEHWLDILVSLAACRLLWRKCSGRLLQMCGTSSRASADGQWLCWVRLDDPLLSLRDSPSRLLLGSRRKASDEGTGMAPRRGGDQRPPLSGERPQPRGGCRAVRAPVNQFSARAFRLAAQRLQASSQLKTGDSVVTITFSPGGGCCWRPT